MELLSKEFITKNKLALLEEMTSNLRSVKQLILSASVEPDTIGSAFVGVANLIGSIDTCFTQYMIFCRGELPQQHAIGFQAFDSEDEPAAIDDGDITQKTTSTGDKKPRATN